MTLWTIGYERRTPDELIARLRGAGVRQLVDVRELPLSRRKGFSKTALREALERAGLTYVHLREAGNPFRHDGDPTLSAYAARLDGAPDVVERAIAVVSEAPSALLCVEADPAHCHRTVLAARIAARTGMAIVEL